ncbi:MAG TPA: hypothetical protein VGJ32_08425 [Solirubrobacteraceae bacterium]
MRTRLVMISLALLALVAAGCGGGGGSGGAGSSGTHSSGSVTVRSSDLGKILVDGSGRTVYLFEKDRGARSECSGACAKAWPPLTVKGRPTGGGGASAGLLGTTRRSDGSLQVTYAGHPVYRFAGDSKPGDTKGQGSKAFGAEWYVLDARGKKVEKGEDESSSGGY